MGRRDEKSIALLYRGLHNAMRQCGIFSGAVAQVPAPTLIREFIWLYAHLGTVVETFSAPVDSRSLFLTTSLAVKADGILMGFGVK